MTIGKQLAVGFAAVVSITLVVGAYAFAKFVSVHQNSNIVTDSGLPKTTLALTVQSLQRESAMNFAQHFLSSDRSERQQSEKYTTEISQKLNEYSNLNSRARYANI